MTGRSHGGYLTMQMLTQFPELWACGVAGVPFFDHIDAQVDPAVRDDLVWWDIENCGDMVKDRARLEYYSPINHLDRVTAPLLILAADLRPALPHAPDRHRGRQAARRRHGCEAVIYPDEGHEISGLEHRVDYERRTVELHARPRRTTTLLAAAGRGTATGLRPRGARVPPTPQVPGGRP